MVGIEVGEPAVDGLVGQEVADACNVGFLFKDAWSQIFIARCYNKVILFT